VAGHVEGLIQRAAISRTPADSVGFTSHAQQISCLLSYNMWRSGYSGHVHVA
jgi:hypothetical protein